MANNIKTFYDTDIAMLEHDAIKEMNVLEWTPENLMWYLAGMHDFAQKLIEAIHEKEAF